MKRAVTIILGGEGDPLSGDQFTRGRGKLIRKKEEGKSLQYMY